MRTCTVCCSDPEFSLRQIFYSTVRGLTKFKTRTGSLSDDRGTHIFCKISCLPASPRIFEHVKKWYDCPLKTDFYPKKGHLEFLGAFFLAEIFETVGIDPYNFRITRRLARKSEQMKNFQGIEVCLYLPSKY